MRRMREIRRNPRISKAEGSCNMGSAEITLNGWAGSVVWSVDRADNGTVWEHVSVSPYDLGHTPTWDEMCEVKDIFFEDEEEAVQFHPKKSDYVNLQKNCLHIWRPAGGFPLPYAE